MSWQQAYIPAYPALGAGLALEQCWLLEAKAAVSLSPWYLGVGLAVTLDLPIAVEVCGVTGPGLVRDVEVRLSGPGLFYSSPGIEDALATLLAALRPDVLEEGRLELAKVHEAIGLDTPFAELAYASLFGTALVTPTAPLLLAGEPSWVLVVRLPSPVEPPAGRPDGFAALLFALDPYEALRRSTRAQLKLLAGVNESLAELARKLLGTGAYGVTVDSYGGLLVAFYDSYSDLLDSLVHVSGFTGGTGYAYGRIVYYEAG